MSLPSDRSRDSGRDPFNGVVGSANAHPGMSYTGATLLYQHPQGHYFPMWSGEMHGEWGGDNDPATHLAGSAGAFRDHPRGEASLPRYMLLYRPHPHIPNEQQAYSVFLGGKEGDQVRERALRNRPQSR